MKKYILNSLIIGLIVLGSCAKKEKIGPDLEALYKPVQFATPFAVNNTSPNFSVGDKVYFSAKFKNETYWLITVTGNTSGAVKYFYGTGTFISNATWDGSADILPSFAAETVSAELSFPRSATSFVSIGLTIVGAKNHDAGNVLITDFSTTKFGLSNANVNTLWPSDWVATVTGNNIPYSNPDGNQYCRMGPNAAWQNNASYPGHKSPYIDFLTISANAQGYPTYFPLIADPSQIYFNAMVYYDPLVSINADKMWFQVILHEEDKTNPSSIVAKSVNIYFKTPVNGVLPPARWDLVSIPYLDFKTSDSTQTHINPQKIKDVQLVLLSKAKQDVLDAGTYPVSVTFDHLIFTHYKPYQP